ncbi:MAG TPA: DUF2064 domain-containing protein [Chthoniobacterales bacterium]|nr:DUF2064 domain-containing protein [Chthoniobacterales bacterium]
MNRKAVLIFAEATGLDLSRRRFPRALQSLLALPDLAGTNAGTDFHLFTSGRGTTAAFPGLICHEQRGTTFAQRLEAAVEEIASLGYDEVVLVGSDCPTLVADDIAIAFAELETKRLVLGPDHRGGCYLIGLRLADRQLLRAITWNRGRDCAQLSKRVDAAEVAYLFVKQDVDTWADVHLLARSGHRLAALLATFCQAGQRTHDFFVDLPAQRQRVRGQIPPPALA